MAKNQTGSFKSRQSARQSEKYQAKRRWLKDLVNLCGYDYRINERGISFYRSKNSRWHAVEYAEFLYFKIKVRTMMYDVGDPQLDDNRKTQEYADALELLMRTKNEDILLDAIIHYKSALNTDGIKFVKVKKD